MVQPTDIADGVMETLPIHFDVPGHQLPLATFVITAVQASAVLRAFNDDLFGGELRYELVVLPPQEGSFLTRLGITVVIGGAIWGFVESDIGKAFIEGLTTHEPSYWAQMAGEHIRREYIEREDEPQPVSDEELHEFECRYSAVILTEVTKSFLQAGPDDLRSVGITSRSYREAFEARNAFYEACQDTPNLRAIGFSEAPDFPVPRSSFSELRVPVTPPDDEVDKPWLTAIQNLKVTSPNWDRDDRQRQWKGKDARGKERYFKIEDEHFWTLVRAERLNPHIIDTIKVQWAFHGTVDNPKSCRVLKVLEYNGKTLSAPYDDNALASLLGTYTELQHDQADLFDQDR